MNWITRWWVGAVVGVAAGLWGAPVLSGELPGAGALPGAGVERWYVILMGGQRVGYAHLEERMEGDDRGAAGEGGRVITRNEMAVSVRRGPVTISIEQSSAFVETAGGEAVSATSRLNMGGVAVQREVAFHADHIEVRATQLGVTQTSRLDPVEGDWLPPAALRRRVSAAVAAGAAEVAARTVDVSMGVTPVSVRLVRAGEEAVEVFGKVVPAVAWDASVSSLPGVTMREYVDASGVAVRSVTRLLPGMELELLAADEAVARGGVDPPELMAALLFRPEGEALGEARSLRRAVYRVSWRDDAAAGRRPALELPSVGAQRVERLGDGSLRVTVDLDAAGAAGAQLPGAGDIPGDGDVGRSVLIDPADPRVRALAAEAVLGLDPGAGPAEVARAMTRFVAGYVETKDLSVGFATSGEVARTAQGDCTEHAVLLAAMLRARGVPARTVSGLVHVEEFLGQRDVMGYHMWTQAWLPAAEGGDAAGMAGGEAAGRWVDWDATVMGPSGFDAGHLALSVSSLAEGEGAASMMALVGVLGRLRVEVLEVGR